MGLSASQGRLLSLTSRMSDLDRRSQSISNQKMRLTSLSTAASQKYQNALNAEKITFDNGFKTVVASAQILTEYNPNLTTQRFLNTSDGKLVVNQEVAAALQGCGNDLTRFLRTMGIAQTSVVKSPVVPSNFATTTETTINKLAASFAASNTTLSGDDMKLLQNAMEVMGTTKSKEIANSLSTYNAEGTSAADKAQLLTGIKSNMSDLFPGNVMSSASLTDSIKNYISSIESYEPFFSAQENTLIKDAVNVLNSMNSYDGENLAETMSAMAQIFTVSNSFDSAKSIIYDEGKVIYYTNIFNEAQSLGSGNVANGIATVSKSNLNNTDWLNTNLTSGNIYLSSKEFTLETGTLASRLSYKTDDSCINVESDSSYIAKAEAEYDATMAEINTKEKRLDLELEQNNTERSAAQQEMDSVKKVMQKNIDRSFKLFA